jgi:hypothetical protein
MTYNHTWSDNVGVWLWVPKKSAQVATEKGLGFPVRKSEILWFGSSSRKIIRAVPRKVDGRSFAVVKTMGSSGGFQQRSAVSRLGDRGGPGRFADSRYSRDFEMQKDRKRAYQSYERKEYRGDAGWKERDNYRQDPNKAGMHKRSVGERERFQREEHDSR